MDRREKIKGFINSEAYAPMKADEMAVVLSVPKEDREEFNLIIDELINEGEIIKTNRGKIISCDKMGYISGIYTCTSRGFGFIIRQEEDDVFIARKSSYGAMNGDRVIARIISESSPEHRREGEIVRIANRANKTIVGILRRSGKNFYVECDNERLWRHIDIKKSDLNGAENGQKVVVKIGKYPTDKEDATGVIDEVLGWPQDNDVKLLSVMYSYGLEREFPKAVNLAAEKVPKELSPDSLTGRRDLRDKIIITIDGEDAKDLDDAVCVEMMENGNYLLSVHIADVSEYVTEGSVIDREALKRGTSVYLPGTVIPMLPPRLSNGICSLNRNSDRLTLSAEMEFDKGGNLVNHNIYTSVISTTERMTYTNVKKIIDGDKETVNEYKNIVPLVLVMNELAKILRKKRMAGGSIDFDFPEAKVIFDNEMNVIDVRKVEITEANELIEEFMLAANSCVAEHFFWINAPFVYRVHETPDSEKIEALGKLLSIFNISIKGRTDEVKPKALADILEKVKNEPYALVVGQTMLRSMKKARYSTECLGHFGLAAKYYCHFTSPIRRYPDLMIHRIIKEYLKYGNLRDNRENILRSAAEAAAIQASETEIKAQEAERTAIKIKVAEYMSAFVGRGYTGYISSVTNFGLFVQLQNMVEGLIHVANMEDDYYDYIADGVYLKGERTGKEYHIGQEVKIVVAAVNELSGAIDFVFEKGE
ncbi:MAG: ribonuclease R [Bacillota bacterium]|nr:ribonuclease R [Bacillota bacterium]